MPRCEHDWLEFDRPAVLIHSHLQLVRIRQLAPRVCAELGQACASLVVALRRHRAPLVVQLQGGAVVGCSLIPLAHAVEPRRLFYQVLR